MTWGVVGEDSVDHSTTGPYEVYRLCGCVDHGMTMYRILVWHGPDKDQASMVQKPSLMLLDAFLLSDCYILCGLCLRRDDLSESYFVADFKIDLAVRLVATLNSLAMHSSVQRPCLKTLLAVEMCRTRHERRDSHQAPQS